MGRTRHEQRTQALGRLEDEIRQEIASSLGRTGRLLEAAIAELQAIGAEAEGAEPARRRALVVRHAELRAEAEQHFLNLSIQREAIGLRRHEELHRHYRIPPPLR